MSFWTRLADDLNTVLSTPAVSSLQTIKREEKSDLYKNTEPMIAEIPSEISAEGVSISPSDIPTTTALKNPIDENAETDRLFFNRSALRRAIIVSEILDKPVSLRIRK